MPRQRDYKVEYRRRIERGLAKGLTRSQARGHARPGESLAGKVNAPPRSDAKIEAAVKLLNQGNALTKAAREASVSVERLRRFVIASGIAKKVGRRWRPTDTRPRVVPLIKDASTRSITVPGFAEASEIVTFSRN